MGLPRIRTLTEAYNMILEADPETAVTRAYIRRIAPSLPGTIRRGRGWLINYDNLLAYLNNPNRAELDRLLEYERAGGSIRPVPETL